MSDPSGRPMLGDAGTALIEHASGRTLAAAGAKGREGGRDSQTIRFTFPPPTRGATPCCGSSRASGDPAESPSWTTATGS